MVTSDAHAAARTRLAELVRAIDPCGHVPMLACSRCVADAILSAPGVEVSEQRQAVATSGFTFDVAPDSEYATHSQVVIRLPAQPIEEGDVSTKRRLPATVGPEADETRPVCAYSQRHGQPACGEPATRHVVTDSAHYGLVGLASCDEHVEIARRAGALIEEHPYATAACMSGEAADPPGDGDRSDA